MGRRKRSSGLCFAAVVFLVLIGCALRLANRIFTGFRIAFWKNTHYNGSVMVASCIHVLGQALAGREGCGSVYSAQGGEIWKNITTILTAHPEAETIIKIPKTVRVF